MCRCSNTFPVLSEKKQLEEQPIKNAKKVKKTYKDQKSKLKEGKMK
jgi:hypothetical protein